MTSIGKLNDSMDSVDSLDKSGDDNGADQTLLSAGLPQTETDSKKQKFAIKFFAVIVISLVAISIVNGIRMLTEHDVEDDADLNKPAAIDDGKSKC